MLSKIRSNLAVRRFWGTAVEVLDSLQDELAEFAGDTEMELDDESSAGKDTREFKELAKLFNKVNAAYENVEKAIKIAKRNDERVTEKS